MKKATPGNAIKAKCHECMGYYADGMVDCEIVTCPLYAWMPYRTQEIDNSWCLRNPKRVGVVEHVHKPRSVPWLKRSIPERKN